MSNFITPHRLQRQANQCPVKALFLKLFLEAAADSADNPNLPTHYVKRGCFHQQARKQGLGTPENFIEAIEWEENHGLVDFAHFLISAWHKHAGTDFTPMEKGSWRFRMKQQRKNSQRGNFPS